MRWALATLLLFASPIDLLDLERLPPGGRLGPEWRTRAVESAPLPELRIVTEEGRRALRISGRGAAGWVVRQLPRAAAPGSGELRWEWRVLQQPQGADLRQREDDDAALRIFVVFGSSGSLSRRSRAIFYTWGNAEPEGLELPSHVSGNFHVVRLAGQAEAGGAWRAEAADSFRDYRRFWDRDPEPITAVGLMQDTDMTGMPAVGELRALMWHPLEPGASSAR